MNHLPKPKILCVDDEQGVLDSLTRLLKIDFEVISGSSAEQGLALAEQHSDIAVIVSDYRMPGMNGVEFLQQMKKFCPTAARTILSGQMDINELSEAINSAEIHRFFLKPWENDYLKLQIHEAVQTHVNLTEKNHYKFLSITDPVTGLKNHRFFQDELKKCIESNELVSLVMLDVDHFKSFNDRYGHPEGDRLLAQIGDLLASHVSAPATASRYGGEEFAIILPNYKPEQAMEFAENLRSNIASQTMLGPGRNAYVTASLGIASSPSDASGAEDIIEKADAALYLSKSQGRNQSQHYRP